MDEGKGLRQLLIADLALVRGLVKAQDVAAALMRAWDPGGDGLAPIAAELVRIAGLEPNALDGVEREADRLIEAAGGNARTALTRHGGLDRSIHAALGSEGVNVSRALTSLGASVRTPLRAIPADRYIDFKPAGEGGMGVVYMALDTELNRLIAFKMVRPDAGSEAQGDAPTTPLNISKPEPDTDASRIFEELKARFLQEAWVTGGMEHPGVVPVYELGETDAGIPYYTMRFVRGQRTLKDALDEVREAPVDDRLHLLEPFLKLCDTVRYAHSKGVIHRDLKPENVALGKFGETVLLDWGLAKLEGLEDLVASRWQERVKEFREAEDLATVAGALGTPGYMSPEAALGQLEQVDPKSDVYSLGVVLFEILTGRLPYKPKTYAQYLDFLGGEAAPEAISVDADISAALSDLCARCLELDRSVRVETVDDLTQAVRQWQAASAIEREVQELLRDAKAALDAAESASAEARLRQVDRAAAALAQMAARQPENAKAASYRKHAAALREEGIREREKASGRRLLVRVGAAALILATVTGFVVAGAIEGKRNEAVDAREESEEARRKTQAALADKTAALGREQRAVAEKDQALGEKTAALAARQQALTEKTEALATVKTERDAKAEALDRVLRLADAKKVRDLLDEVDRLWPLGPEKAGDMTAWIERAEAVLGNRKGHADVLVSLRKQALEYTEEQRLADHAADIERIEKLRADLAKAESELETLQKDQTEEGEKKLGGLEKQVAATNGEIERLAAVVKEQVTWHFASDRDAWRHQVLSDLVADLSRLQAEGEEKKGALADVKQRHTFVSTLRAQPSDDHRAAWDEVIAAIAASPEYGGLKIARQLGLAPLGPDPDSHLFEFTHLGSGSLPKRDEKTGRLVQEDDAAIVLVLIPGGTFLMGAQKEDAEKPNYDPQAGVDEPPVHEVTLSPYFLSKYECTQAQWARMTGGLNPSHYKAGQIFGDTKPTVRNPVEQVSWEDCERWLGRHRLLLPTEAQWEYACRARTDWPWFSGRETADLSKIANIADAYLQTHGGSHIPVSPEVSDGHAVHAPVGSFAANPFGLHDVHGNVWEWCRDTYRGYPSGPTVDPVGEGSDTRVFRGGSWFDPASSARSADRSWRAPGLSAYDLGSRPACPVTR